MSNKICVGILFGGISKEREISFAGGRTVYDNLNKTIFEAVPYFVDSFGNFIELDWEFVYKGSVRDFYPPVKFIPDSPGEFQIYAENLGPLSKEQEREMASAIGKVVSPEDIASRVDFVFLCLHGPYGEDGKIQGLLDYYQIPYSGSGILSSAIGIDKATQKRLMVNAGFHSPKFITVRREDYFNNTLNKTYAEALNLIGFPLVVKPATQGSSIGVSILTENSEEEFRKSVEKALFITRINKAEWESKSESQKNEWVRTLADIREGMGMPVLCGEETIYHPDALIVWLNSHKWDNKEVLIQSLDAEAEVLVEGFIEGKEFSCIVVQNEKGLPIALPPTEIRKGKELFDYRSKYLPGLSRKITPIDLPEEKIQEIRQECERLFTSLGFGVYARIDGFVGKDGIVFLNDPNTTSGMMPSSFFFHQAAEIGLNPSQFLSYIIRTSLAQRLREYKVSVKLSALLQRLDASLDQIKKDASRKSRIAVFLGGYSSERHISVESGRNIYEKLSSSIKYQPIPVFVSGNNDQHYLHIIPVNVLLKDNADDILEKVNHYKVHPIIQRIIKDCGEITEKYADVKNLKAPYAVSYQELAGMADGVFIALHGRPGEDGKVQSLLEQVGLPYNGSGVESSMLTINKYETNEILQKNGLSVAKHTLINQSDWMANAQREYERIEQFVGYPFIAKPVDDGCSSAVKKIKNREELDAFSRLMFRDQEELIAEAAQVLHVKPKEEFPFKKQYLIEELISRKDAVHFLEITGGMLTRFNEKGELVYEVFEASEALSEGDVLSLEEKFLAGQGQNITPARYAKDPAERQRISDCVKKDLEKAAKALGIVGYTRIDAFVRIFADGRVETIFVEANSLPGMTPATCIFHQSAINGYKPYEFIDRILDFGFKRFNKPMVKE